MAFLSAIAIIFCLGAAIGSFLNVVVYRLPAGLSLLFPPSRCPHCHSRLSASENIPILGWLWLQGRCSHCKQRIPRRYPLVEAATGILFVLVFWSFGISWQTLGYWLFFSWLLALSLIDLDTMSLPNALTRSGMVVGLIFQGLIGFSLEGSASGLINQLMQGVLGAVVGIWTFDLIALTGAIALGQPAMGGGDAKLAAMIGAWLGWQRLLIAAFLACGVGAAVGSGAIALGWLERRQPVPFGPYLAVGAMLTAVWGQTILLIYLRWFWPSA